MKPSQVIAAINDLIELREPFFLWGPPGVGKSEIMRQVTAARKMQLADVRLSQMDSIDLRGFPNPDRDKNRMGWLPPDFLPPSNTKTKGILFFDELNSAPQANQAPCYQLFLDGRLGAYELPGGWMCAGAGNRETDHAIVHRMSTALANRMVHLEVEVDADEWRGWARKNGLLASTIGYIGFRRDNLMHFDLKSKSPAFATPRAWAKVDRIERRREGLDRTVTRALIRGTVGEGVALDYEAYIESQAELLSLEEIRLNPETTKVPKSMAAAHAVAQMLVDETTIPAFPGILKYVARLPKEIEIIYARDVVKEVEGLKNTPAWKEWAFANHEVLF